MEEEKYRSKLKNMQKKKSDLKEGMKLI